MKIKGPQLGDITEEMPFLIWQPAKNADRAAIWRDEAEDCLEKRGLSPSVRPDDCINISRKDPEVDPFEDYLTFPAEPEVFNLNYRFFRHLLLTPCVNAVATFLIFPR